MLLDDVRSFARRDWEAVERSKRGHWARVWREQGPAAAWAACTDLWERLRTTSPRWPDDAQRAEDLDHHVEVARKLARARHVVPVR